MKNATMNGKDDEVKGLVALLVSALDPNSGIVIDELMRRGLYRLALLIDEKVWG